MSMGFAPTWLRQVTPQLLHKTTLTTARIAKAARSYRTDPEMNLFTACHDLYDESTRKFNRKNY